MYIIVPSNIVCYIVIYSIHNNGAVREPRLDTTNYMYGSALKKCDAFKYVRSRIWSSTLLKVLTYGLMINSLSWN